MYMNETQFKDMLKELFKTGEIEISTSVEDDWSGKVIVTKVYIDGAEVSKIEQNLRL